MEASSPQSGPVSGRDHRLALAFLIAAAVLSFLVFATHLDGEYVWDDIHLVKRNPVVQLPGQLGRLLASDLWGPEQGRPSQLYHPIPMLTLWAETRLGASLPGHRAVNIAIHLACGFLLFLLLRQDLGWAFPAVGAASLFLLHPSVTEPVMWLTGRHDTLGVAAAILAMLVWSSASLTRALGAAFLAAASVLCKEPYVVVPGLLFALEMRRMREARQRPHLAQIGCLALPFLAVAAVFGLRRVLGISAASDQLHASLGVHITNFGTIVWHYLAQLANFSNGATIQTWRPLAPKVGITVFVSAVAAVLAMGITWWRGNQTAGRVLFGLVWFLLALTPHILSLPLIGVWGNRYAYFPLAGLLYAGASAVAGLANRVPRRVRIIATAATGLAVCSLAPLTSSEAGCWRNEVILFGSNATLHPTDGKVLFHWGAAVANARGCGEALSIFERAVVYDPTEGRSWHNLAGCLLDLQRFAEAVRPAERAFALQPRDIGSEYNLGAALLLSGQTAEGISHLRSCRRRNSAYEPARKLLLSIGQD
jgi:protein O-mannosyl-transferase